MCEIEDVNLLLLPKILGFLRCHGLHANVPTGELAALDRIVQVHGRIVRRLGVRILLRDKLDTLLALEVELAVDPLASLVDQLHGVATIAVHVTVSIWNTSVAH